MAATELGFHVPVLAIDGGVGAIGGGGERRTLRLVAQCGDACNLFATSPADVTHKLDVLRRHCDAVGRDYDTIRPTITGRVTGTHDEFVRHMAEYADLGVHTAMVTPTTGSPAAWIDDHAPVVPQLAGLG